MKEMNGAKPDPARASSFRFTRCDYSAASGEARLGYRFDDGPELVEKVCFPHAPWPPEASRQSAFNRALQILHLVAGVSYYKAGLPPDLLVQEPSALNGLEGFLQELYREGLAEMAHVNGLELDGRIRFRQAGKAGPKPAARSQALMLPERALVAMGGGKDSLVGLDLVQRSGLEVLPVCVGGSGLIEKTVKAAGLPLLRIGRSLAPELEAMNRAGALNGHVPVTAINSAILVCAAILYGFRYVVFSNERSADEATLVADNGVEINHQYSKSSGFERAFRTVIASQVSPELEYFSILRPFSEIDIVGRFSRMAQFHRVYSSCNRNFHLDGPRLEGRWCLDCPKCRFAALSLALFLAPEEVIGIQGGDLLDDVGQEQGFRALCNLGHEKPFECVGEAGESRAAMLRLADDPRWRDHAVVRSLSPELSAVAVTPLAELMRPSPAHCIPSNLLQRLESAGAFNAA